MRKMLRQSCVLALLVSLGACDGGAGGDGGLDPVDGSAADSGASDSGPADSGAPDTGTLDAGGMDSGVDGGPLGPFALGGVVTGLSHAVVLELNGAETLRVDENGSFVFVALVSDYAVEVVGLAEGEFCAVAPASGVLAADGSAALTVTCEAGTLRETDRAEFDDGALISAHRERHTREGDARVSISLESTGVGDDGQLFTDDDDGFEANRSDEDLNHRKHLLATSVMSLGPDGEPGTIDDVLNDYEVSQLDAFGEVVRYEYYQEPGPDGLWRTADDVLEGSSTRHRFDRDGMDRVTCEATWEPGADLLLDTADDSSFLAETSTYTADAVIGGTRQDARTARNSFGDDNLPCTADDPITSTARLWTDAQGHRFLIALGSSSSYTERRFDAFGNIIRQTRWETGADAIFDGPERGDDVISLYVLSGFDASGRPLFRVSVDDPGTDGLFFTEDDLLRQRTNYEARDAEGRLTEFLQYESGTPVFGPDGVLGTPDDVASTYARNEYDGDVLTCGVRASSPGPNGTWDVRGCGNTSRLGGAPDDVIQWVDFTRVDGAGLPVSSRRATAPGPDGLWATDDDVIDVDALTIERPDARTTISYIHTDYGPDTVPFTADDVIGRAFVTQTDAMGDDVLGAEIGGPGPDGEFFTGDDVDVSLVRRVRDAVGSEIQRLSYDGPGPDALWYTDDDRVSRDVQFTHFPASLFPASSGT